MKIPILQGTRWVVDGPDYTDHATCGALLGWCHGEFNRVLAATPKGSRFALNAAHIRISEARVWDHDSVRAAVDAVCALGGGE